MEIEFIPLDYECFDYQNKNYMKIFGKIFGDKKVCAIDNCDIYFWVILKRGVGDKKIKEIEDKLKKIKLGEDKRDIKVIKTEVHYKKFLGQDVKAIKIFVENFKDISKIVEKINKIGIHEIDKIRGTDIPHITRYIIEKKLVPLTWYNVKCENLN